jgi:hypothetical protein
MSTKILVVGEAAVAVARRRQALQEMERTDSKPHIREARRQLSQAEQELAAAVDAAIMEDQS